MPILWKGIMKVHLIGSLLCAGMLMVATSGGALAAGDKKQPAKAEGSGTVSRTGKQVGPRPVSIKLEEISSRKTKTPPTKKD